MGTEYKVLKIDELNRVAQGGGLEKYYKHQVKTKGGVIFTIDIAEKDFTPEKVAPIILAQAQDIDKILAL